MSDDECTSLFPDPHFGLYKVRKSKRSKEKIKTSADDTSIPVVRINSRLATCRSRLLMENIKSMPRSIRKDDPQENIRLGEGMVACDDGQLSRQNAESPASQISPKAAKTKHRSSISENSSSPENRLENAMFAYKKLEQEDRLKMLTAIAGLGLQSDQVPCSSVNRVILP